MKTLVLGSINFDKTYTVDHLVKTGETIASERQEIFVGGKGFNQAVALARSNCEVFFAGAVGDDGELLKEALRSEKINAEFLASLDGSSGHSVIQIDRFGQNCIIISAGTNGRITKEYIDDVLSHFSKGDLIVLQNEISNVNYAIKKAKEKGLLIAYNPSPISNAICEENLSKVNYLLINEVEAFALSGESEPKQILLALHNRFPETTIVLTLGEKGSTIIKPNGETLCCGIYNCPVVDTTAAGDTFSGYYLAQVIRGTPDDKALLIASIASGIAVSRKGASPSIPYWEEVKAVLDSR